MSKGQKPRTREHFPRMKDRAGQRRRRRSSRKWARTVEAFKAVNAALVRTAELVVEAFAPFAQAIEYMTRINQQKQLEPPLPHIGPPTASDLDRLGDWHYDH